MQSPQTATTPRILTLPFIIWAFTFITPMLFERIVENKTFKGQLISEWPFDALNFPKKNNPKIWWNSALKPLQNKKGKKIWGTRQKSSLFPWPFLFWNGFRISKLDKLEKREAILYINHVKKPLIVIRHTSCIGF